MPGTTQSKTNWLVYIIKASDGRLYTGITNDMVKRWHSHNNTKQGAKFFRGRSPEQIRYVESNHDRSSASRREYVIKQLSRREKLELISNQNIDWHEQVGIPQPAKLSVQ
jgi:putative endonuclease